MALSKVDWEMDLLATLFPSLGFRSMIFERLTTPEAAFEAPEPALARSLLQKPGGDFAADAEPAAERVRTLPDPAGFEDFPAGA